MTLRGLNQQFPPLLFCVFYFLVALQSFAQEAGDVQDPKIFPGQLPRLTRLGGTIFRCLFDAVSDAEDGNNWPDYWSRKHGIDRGVPFPDHLEISAVQYRNPFSNYALRMDMQGGGAAAFSPKIPIKKGMSYVVSAYVDATGIVFDEVSILLLLYNKTDAIPVKIVDSEKVRSTNGWVKLEIGPVIADQEGIESISIGLLVLPGLRQDYGAKVHFANVEIRESPTVTLTTSNRHHLFPNAQNVDVTAQLRGVDPAQKTVDFVLEDPFGRIITRKKIELFIGNKPAAQFVVAPGDEQTVLSATASWQGLPIRSPGFYRVRLASNPEFIQSLNLPDNILFEDPLADVALLTLAVMQSGNFLPLGEFGWNLEGWTLDEIESGQMLLAQSGISRLKIPAWLPSDADPTLRRRLLRLCDDLVRRQVKIVGLLQPVPEEVRKLIPYSEPTAAALFSLPPDQWTESLQTMLGEFSLLVKDWQWTADSDLSVTESPGFSDRFAEMRKSFDRNDFNFGVGFAWDWSVEVPDRFERPEPSGDTPDESLLPKRSTEFVALSGKDVLTSEELQFHLRGSEASPMRRFVSLVPLSEKEYSLQDRIVDMVRKMVLAKMGGAEAIFLADPRNRKNGVLYENETPSELYLPWRTTSTMISGRTPMGSFVMPNRSVNYCFDTGDGKATMVVWNDLASVEEPISETLYLGEEVELIDIWGRRADLERRGREQVIPVGPIPIFVTGLDALTVQLRTNFSLLTREIPSTPNRDNTLSFSLANRTDQYFSVTVSPVGPVEGAWHTTAAKSMALEPGQTGESTFGIRLTGGANTGIRPIRLDLETAGAQPRVFSVYDDLLIGERDVFMEVSSRMNRNGDIEIFQDFINNGDTKYTYTCQLFIPGRVHQQTYISQKGFGRFEYVYTIPRGRELIERGVQEVTLRARPIGPGQPMVYTVPVGALNRGLTSQAH